MMIWRYSSHLMGILPELLFEDKADALKMVEIGKACEPAPSIESCQLANALINAAPLLQGIEDSRKRRILVNRIYQVSRAMIGDEVADSLRYPPKQGFGALAAISVPYRINHWLESHCPLLARKNHLDRFGQMMDISHYGDSGLAYRLPGHVHAEKDSPL